MDETIAITQGAYLLLMGTRTAGLIALCACSVLLCRRLGRTMREMRTAVVWMAGYCALMLLATIGCHHAVSEASEEAVRTTANVIFASGCLIAVRPLLDLALDRAGAANESIEELLCIWRDVFALLAAAMISRQLFDLPWNALFDRLPQESVQATTQLVLLCFLALYFLGQRSGVPVLLGVVFCCVAGVGQYFVTTFKGVPMMPSDLAGLTTAVAVGEGYDYLASDACLKAIGLATAASALVCLVHPRRLADAIQRHKRLRRNLVLGAAFAAAFVALLTQRDYRGEFGLMDEWYWSTLTAYEEHGFVPTFLAFWQDPEAVRPTGYSAGVAHAEEQDLAAEYDVAASATSRRSRATTQFSEEHPSIVMVMNESFADLSIYENLHAGYDGPQFFKTGFGDALVRGELAVSVFGGGTCNSEFEVLTGISLGYLGKGLVPYTTHDFSTTASIVDQLRSLGYATCAIHPQAASNWNRDDVYPAMGFDRFLSIEDFDEDAEQYHSGVRDRVTYEKVLEVLAQDDTPQFVFDVTMANHGGYTRDNIPRADRLSYAPRDLDDSATNAQLNEYLACIEASDEDLEWFVGELRRLKRPVVLVFFGDHQPGFADVYNSLVFGGEAEDDPLAFQERQYQTAYVVWANYDVAGSAQDARDEATSTEALAALTFDAIGAPLTSLQKATLAAHRQITQVNAYGYRGEDGVWYAAGAESAYAELYTRLQHINYLEFGSLY